MKIPFLSFDHINSSIKSELTTAFNEFVNSGWYILGERLKTFESEYALYSGTKFCAGVGNGLDAIIIALKACNIGRGDEVIVPSNTYIASWLAITHVGATPIPVEPRPDTFNINPDLIEEKITIATKAILPVHLYGQSCEMDKIMSIANAHNLLVIEDNAQSQGATFKGKMTGSFGHINATSFYPGKNLGAYGDAGAITSDNYNLIELSKVIRNYGSRVKYFNEIKGLNSRLDELQACLLSIKLKQLDEMNSLRIGVAQKYNEALQNTGDLILPYEVEGSKAVYHLYVVRTERRDELQKKLNDNGIGTLIHYPRPPHLQEAYVELNYKKGDFPITEKMAETCLSLPIYPGLNDDEIHFIANQIKEFYNA